MELAAMVLLAIQSIAPAGQVSPERAERLAEDVAAVVSEQPPIRLGPRPEERTALLLVALAWAESRLDERVERCERVPFGWQDNGRSIGLTQLLEGKSWRGHDRDEICSNPRLQLSLGLEWLRRSGSCGSGPAGYVTMYQSGQCAHQTPAATKVEGWYRFLVAKLLRA